MMAQSTNIRDYLEVRDRTSANNQDLWTHNVMRSNGTLNQRKPKILWKPSIECPLRFKILLEMLFVRIDDLILEAHEFLKVIDRISAVIQRLLRRITLCVMKA
jgi:hypothetical protein